MNVELPPTVEQWNEYIKTKPEEWDAYESGCDCADCREFIRGFYDWRRTRPLTEKEISDQLSKAMVEGIRMATFSEPVDVEEAYRFLMEKLKGPPGNK